MKVDIYNTDKKYNIIYADPPWEYKDKALSGNRGACCKYDVINEKDIENIPVKKHCRCKLYIIYVGNDA